MKALITGITGFVGKYLELFLEDKADYGTSRSNRSEKHVFKVDLLSESKIDHQFNNNMMVYFFCIFRFCDRYQNPLRFLPGFSYLHVHGSL